MASTSAVATVVSGQMLPEYDGNVVYDGVAKLPSQQETSRGARGGEGQDDSSTSSTISGGGVAGQTVTGFAASGPEYERDKCMKHGGLRRRVATRERAWQLQRDGTIAVREKVKLGWSCDNVKAVQTHSTSLSDCMWKAEIMSSK